MKLLTIIDTLAGKWLNYRTVRSMKSAVVDEPELLHLEASLEKGIDIAVAHPTFAILADELVNLLQENNAPNFLEMIVQPRIDRGQRTVVVTVRYQDGETPAQQCHRLKEELASVNERVERAISVLRIYETGPAKYASDILSGAS